MNRSRFLVVAGSVAALALAWVAAGTLGEASPPDIGSRIVVDSSVSDDGVGGGREIARDVVRESAAPTTVLPVAPAPPPPPPAPVPVPPPPGDDGIGDDGIGDDEADNDGLGEDDPGDEDSDDDDEEPAEDDDDPGPDGDDGASEG